MKTNRFLNTIFFNGPKLYNSIMFNNILKIITIIIDIIIDNYYSHIFKLKKYKI